MRGLFCFWIADFNWSRGVNVPHGLYVVAAR
jgi:hypothetical protein